MHVPSPPSDALRFCLFRLCISRFVASLRDSLASPYLMGGSSFRSRCDNLTRIVLSSYGRREDNSFLLLPLGHKIEGWNFPTESSFPDRADGLWQAFYAFSSAHPSRWMWLSVNRVFFNVTVSQIAVIDSSRPSLFPLSAPPDHPIIFDMRPPLEIFLFFTACFPFEEADHSALSCFPFWTLLRRVPAACLLICFPSLRAQRSRGRQPYRVFSFYMPGCDGGVPLLFLPVLLCSPIRAWSFWKGQIFSSGGRRVPPPSLILGRVGEVSFSSCREVLISSSYLPIGS